MGKTSTRAGYEGVITDTQLKGGKTGGSITNGFGVFAYNTGTTAWASASIAPNFMYNQQVYWATDWKYEPVKYWPNGKDAANSTSPSNTATPAAVQMLSFFAYAPYVNPNPSSGTFDSTESSGITQLSTNSKTGDPMVHYTLDASHKVDLLWGTRGDLTYSETDGTDNTLASLSPYAYNVDLTKQNKTEKVNFVFKHALAKLGGNAGLKVVLDVDDNGSHETGNGSLDQLSNVTISNITVQNKANNAIPSGVFDLANGTWYADESKTAITVGTSTAGSYVNYNISSTDMNSTIYHATGGTYDAGTWTPTGVPTATAINVFKDGSGDPFYLIPGAEQTLTISVTYTVRTYDTNLSGSYSTVTQTITNDVKITPAVNKFYTIVLHLGLTSVKFAASVSDWDAATDTEKKEVWLPSNVVPAPAP